MNNTELKKIANNVRKDIVTAVHAAKSGHPGGSLSAVEILTALYFDQMNIDPTNPKMGDKILKSDGIYLYTTSWNKI